MYKGKVFLVGAGPGDPDLITLKAKKVLERAEVVLHDRLINKEILKHVPKNATVISVGKEYGRQQEIQQKIYDLLSEYVNKGKMVIRLKGGDPFIFGRGAEELEYLLKNGIEFEIVPGVSSALSVPSLLKIPLTHRKYSSSIAIVTGHEDPAKVKKNVNFELLARCVDTIVILMGLKNSFSIIQSFIKAGLNKETPIAVIERGFFPDQKIITGTIENILEKLKKEKQNPPAIIIIGSSLKFLHDLPNH